MCDPGEYRRRALSYGRLAQTARSTELRHRLLSLAQTWDRLAIETEDYEALLCQRQMRPARRRVRSQLVEAGAP
jgi:hypothetical protein